MVVLFESCCEWMNEWVELSWLWLYNNCDLECCVGFGGVLLASGCVCCRLWVWTVWESQQSEKAAPMNLPFVGIVETPAFTRTRLGRWGSLIKWYSYDALYDALWCNMLKSFTLSTYNTDHIITTKKTTHTKQAAGWSFFVCCRKRERWNEELSFFGEPTNPQGKTHKHKHTNKHIPIEKISQYHGGPFHFEPWWNFVQQQEP